MNNPRLIDVRVPEGPEGAVLVLHGGARPAGKALAANSTVGPMVSPTQLSVIRMVPIARRIARSGRGRLAVFRLLNSMRGWDTTHTPVLDVQWALAQLRDRFGGSFGGGVPTCLVGHSLGGRAALMAGGEPDVRSVVALNPWVYPTDHADLAGRRVLIVHGADDRVADPATSAAVARALGRSTRVDYVSVPGARHAMLRHGSVFEKAAARFAVETLLGEAPTGEAPA